MRAAASVALATVSLSGCAPRRPPTPPPVLHAVVGSPYQINGLWRYPHASYEYDETGLADIVTTHAPFATDGAAWDAAALMAAHPTLQLPAVARVTNLETGQQILLRIDDRGPVAPGRLLGLTPRAAALLGGGSEAGLLRVRVVVDEAASRQLTTALGDPDAPPLAIASLPARDVRTEALSAPGAHVVPGVAAGLPAGPPLLIAAAPVSDAASQVPLPTSVAQVPVRPTALWIDAGGLGSPRYADALRSRLAAFGAVVVHTAAARREAAYRVRVGPFATVPTVDAMLDRMLRAGVVDAKIIVV